MLHALGPLAFRSHACVTARGAFGEAATPRGSGSKSTPSSLSVCGCEENLSSLGNARQISHSPAGTLLRPSATM